MVRANIKLRDKLKTHFHRSVEMVMMTVFNLMVFICAVLALRFAIFLTGYFFSQETVALRVTKTVSSIGVISTYAFHTILDLICCVREVMKGKYR
jgi:capsule polysaccharide export protein KpsE/RkpR